MSNECNKCYLFSECEPILSGREDERDKPHKHSHPPPFPDAPSTPKVHHDHGILFCSISAYINVSLLISVSLCIIFVRDNVLSDGMDLTNSFTDGREVYIRFNVERILSSIPLYLWN